MKEHFFLIIIVAVAVVPFIPCYDFFNIVKAYLCVWPYVYNVHSLLNKTRAPLYTLSYISCIWMHCVEFEEREMERVSTE